MTFFARVACLIGLAASPPAAAEELRLFEDGLSIPRLYAYDIGALHGIALHEVGHALVAMGLPLPGPEEDIADEFAVMQLIALAQQGEEGHALAQNYIRAFLAQALQAVRLERDHSPFDGHSSFGKRAYNALILLYGAFPERYGALADDLRLSAYDRERATPDYRRKAAIWASLLKPYAPAGGGATFSVISETLTQPPRYLYESSPLWVAYAEEVLAPQLNALLHLPRPLKLEVGTCAAGGNARYDDAAGTVKLCASQIGDLERVLVSVRTGVKFKTWWRDTLTAGAQQELVGGWVDPRGRTLTLAADGTYTGVEGETGFWGVEGGRMWQVATAWPAGAAPAPSTAALIRDLHVRTADRIELGRETLTRAP